MMRLSGIIRVISLIVAVTFVVRLRESRSQLILVATISATNATEQQTTTEKGGNDERIIESQQVVSGTTTNTTTTTPPIVATNENNNDNNNNITRLPALKDILHQQQIIGNPQRLFDFVVAGFAKCGTTSLIRWLYAHDQVCTKSGEMIYLRKSPPRQIKKMIQIATSKHCVNRTVFGYKNPHDVQYNSTLRFFRQYAPKTKFIVSIRHPVTFFESFYNYRWVKGEKWAIHGTPNELVGGVDKPPYQVWSYSGAFHRYLALLGKTPLDDDEQELLREFLPNSTNYQEVPKLVNPIFLVESSQLDDTNQTRLEQLRVDLQNYLGLTEPISPEVPHSNERKKHGPFDICDPEHSKIHDDTLHVARIASQWILRYFLPHPDVHVSSRAYLETLVQQWTVDPCLERNNQTKINDGTTKVATR